MSKPQDLLEPLNGWTNGLRPKQVSGDNLQVSDGSLYPALHKLELKGWIRSEWRNTENNRRAKLYSFTRPRRARLAKKSANWDRPAGAISGIVCMSEA